MGLCSSSRRAGEANGTRTPGSGGADVTPRGNARPFVPGSSSLFDDDQDVPPAYTSLGADTRSAQEVVGVVLEERPPSPEYLDCIGGGVWEWTVEDVCTFVHRNETLRPLEDTLFRGHLVDGPRFASLDETELARCGVSDSALAAEVIASAAAAVDAYNVSAAGSAAPPPQPSPMRVGRLDAALLLGLRVGMLHDVVLQRVAVTPAELRSLVNGCRADGAALRWLGLKGLGLGRAHTTDLVDMIVHVRSLRALDLGGNNINDACAEMLCAAIASSRTLRELSLDHNELGPASGASLARALRRNRSLRSLSLYWNAIGPDGGRAVLVAVRRHRGIQLLDLSSTGLGRSGGISAASTVRHARGLQTLRLADNGLGSEVGVAIAEAVPHNRGLRNLDLSLNRLGTTSVDLLRAWGTNRPGTLKL